MADSERQGNFRIEDIAGTQDIVDGRDIPSAKIDGRIVQRIITCINPAIVIQIFRVAGIHGYGEPVAEPDTGNQSDLIREILVTRMIGDRYAGIDPEGFSQVCSHVPGEIIRERALVDISPNPRFIKVVRSQWMESPLQIYSPEACELCLMVQFKPKIHEFIWCIEGAVECIQVSLGSVDFPERVERVVSQTYIIEIFIVIGQEAHVVWIVFVIHCITKYLILELSAGF